MNENMIPTITKVLCTVAGTSGHYLKGQVYTYLRHGKSVQAEGIVTLENRSSVLPHTSYEVNMSAITNKEVKLLLSQED